MSNDPDDYCDICHGPCSGHGNPIPVEIKPTYNPYYVDPYIEEHSQL